MAIKSMICLWRRKNSMARSLARSLRTPKKRRGAALKRQISTKLCLHGQMSLIAEHAALHATLDLSCRVVSARVNSTCANPLWCRRLPDCTASDEGLRSHSCTMLPSFPTQAFKNASKLSNTSSARLNESWTLLRARAAKLAMQCMVLNERRAQMHDDMSDMLETLEQVASKLQPTAHTVSRRACRVPNFPCVCSHVCALSYHWAFCEIPRHCDRHLSSTDAHEAQAARRGLATNSRAALPRGERGGSDGSRFPRQVP